MKAIVRFFRRFLRQEHGSTAVEFALVAIPCLLIIFGVMEAGRVAWIVNGVQYAVEDTSRFAAINNDLVTADFQDYAEARLQEMSISSDGLLVNTNIVTSSGIDFIEVDASYAVSTMLNMFLPGDFGVFTFNSSVRKPVVD